MCPACYGKYYRSTPSGKASFLRYTHGKGKEATARFRLKKGYKPRSEKITTYCECGDIVVCKGLCRVCYQKDYQSKLAVKKGVVPRGKRKPKIIESEVFNRLVELVASGIPLYKAVMYENISSVAFYKKASESQKQEIKNVRRYKPDMLSYLDEPFN